MAGFTEMLLDLQSLTSWGKQPYVRWKGAGGLHGSQRNENSWWRNFPVCFSNCCSNCSISAVYIYRDFRSIYMRKCHSKWQFKPHVPKFPAEPCIQNQTLNAKINQKFRNEVLSLKLVWPATDDLDLRYHGHCMRDDYRACFVVKFMIAWFM